MRPVNLTVAVAGLLLSPLVLAAESSLTAKFSGTGRSCHGSLIVKSTNLSWITPFSQCKAVPVKLVERQDEKGQLRVTYRLKHRPRHCLYQVVMLQQDLSAQGDGMWSVVGYGSIKSYEADKRSGYTLNASDMMTCPLTRQEQ
jgi:hypothetical protein